MAQVGIPAPGDASTTRARKQADQPRSESRRRPDYEKNRQDDRPLDEREDGPRQNPGEFRRLMQAELTHVPALEKRMERLMTLQEERSELQQKRQKVAAEQPDDREATIKRFHFMLRRDLQLSEESRRIVQEIVSDMPRIEKQLSQRRTTLRKELEDENTTGPGTQTSTTQGREARRRLRYLDFLGNKLTDLSVHPDRLDLLARVLRGLPHDDPSESRARATSDSFDLTTQAALTALQSQRKALQRELRQVEKKIDDLRDGGAAGDPTHGPTKNRL